MENFLCLKEPPLFFFFAPDVPSLLYYSHIPTALISLLLGLFVFLKDRSLAANALLFIAVTFFSWSVIDLILWAQNDSSIIMFFWSVIIFVELLVFFGSLYLVYVFVNKKAPTFFLKIFFAVLLLPAIALLPTAYNLTGFNLPECISFEGIIPINYTYGLELLIIFYIIYISIFKYIKATDVVRKQIILLLFGIVSFLLSFSGANLISSLIGTDIGWTYGNYGLFGMPIFIGFLAYLIVRYKVFNIKLLGAQALTVTLWVLVGALFFLSQNTMNRIVTGVTFLLAVVFGFKLMQSVKREVEQREQIEELAGRLKSVNRIMSHDIKNVLGKNKDMFGMLLDGSFGTLSESARGFLERVHDDTKKLIRSVVVILESGQELKLKPAPFDLKEAVLEVVRDTEPDAKAKGLALATAIDEKDTYTIVADRTQLVTHVLRNLIENAIHYTLAGSITVGLSKKDANTVLFSVKDTGIGIPDEDKPNIFKEGGHGKDSIKVNVHSTGYGLYSVKRIVDAHGGKVWFETEAGKGTTFFVELKVGEAGKRWDA